MDFQRYLNVGPHRYRPLSGPALTFSQGPLSRRPQTDGNLIGFDREESDSGSDPLITRSPVIKDCAVHYYAWDNAGMAVDGNLYTARYRGCRTIIPEPFIF